MDITYTKHGDYYYPDLTLPPRPTGDIGRFGRMRKKYLKQHQPDTLALMLTENTLTQYLIDICCQTNEQIELITAYAQLRNKAIKQSDAPLSSRPEKTRIGVYTQLPSK